MQGTLFLFTKYFYHINLLLFVVREPVLQTAQAHIRNSIATNIHAIFHASTEANVSVFLHTNIQSHKDVFLYHLKQNR